MPRESTFDRLQQLCSCYRLRQKIFRASLYGRDGCRDISMSADKHDREPASQTGKLLLELRPAQPGHLHVKQDAGRPAIQRCVEQFLCGFIERNAISARAQQFTHCRSKGRIVIDDVNRSRSPVHLSTRPFLPAGNSALRTHCPENRFPAQLPQREIASVRHSAHDPAKVRLVLEPSCGIQLLLQSFTVHFSCRSLARCARRVFRGAPSSTMTGRRSVISPPSSNVCRRSAVLAANVSAILQEAHQTEDNDHRYLRLLRLLQKMRRA
jgi:hypothetical protein